MDCCQISLAVSALPKFDDLLTQKFLEWRTTPLNVEEIQEELFFDAYTCDVYISMTFDFSQHQQETFTVRFPVEGTPKALTPEDVSRLDLEDITHLIPEVSKKFHEDAKRTVTLKTALQTSMLMNTFA